MFTANLRNAVVFSKRLYKQKWALVPQKQSGAQEEMAKVCWIDGEGHQYVQSDM